MFSGLVGLVEVFYYWPEAILGDFYWPGASVSLLISSPGIYKYGLLKYFSKANTKCCKKP